jgi:hypothetical protein
MAPGTRQAVLSERAGQSAMFGQNALRLRLAEAVQWREQTRAVQWGTAMAETKPKRRWFTFSIRELLLVTAIIALVAGWWLDHRRLTRISNLESMILKDPTIIRLQSKIFDLYFARDTEVANSKNPNAAIASIDARIADLQKEIDYRCNDLLHSLP